MIRRAVPIVLLLSLLACTVAASADKTADAKKAIQAAYNAENAAAARKDLKGIFASYAPDYVEVSQTGRTTTLTEEKTKARQALSLVKSAKANSVIQKIKLKGKQAVVSVKEHNELVVDNPRTGQPAKMVIDSVSEDTWTKSGKSRLKKRSKTISEKATANGEPLSAD